MLNRCLLILTISLICFTLHAQRTVPKSEDSLAVFLKTQPKDTLYAWAIRPYALIQIYQKANYAKADSLANVQKKLSEKLNYGRGIYFSYLIKAIIHYNKSEPRSALVYFQKCYGSVKKYRLDKQLEEATLNNISLMYDDLGNKDSTLFFALKAVEVQEKNHFKKMDSSPYSTIGGILKENKKYPEALTYYQKALAISEKAKNTQNIAVVENQLGNLYDVWHKIDSAIIHYKRGLGNARKADYPLLQTDPLVNLGRMYTQKKQYAEAERYLKENDKLCRKLESPTALHTSCVSLGEFYIEQKKYGLAEKYYLEALKLAEKTESMEDIEIANRALAVLYETTHQFDKAFQFLSKAEMAHDSVITLKNHEKTEELLTKYETEKKEQQIKLLDKENQIANFQRNAFMVGGLLTLLLAGITIVFLGNRSKLKNLEEKQKLRNKIAADLHDEVGSTLSSISMMSTIAQKNIQQNQWEKTETIVNKINRDSRQTLDAMDDIIWSVNPGNDSLRLVLLRLKEYANPLLEVQEVECRFNIQTDAENEVMGMIPRRNLYMIAKEAINNAAKYAQASKVVVEIKKQANELVLNIEDNGKGFDIEAPSSRNGLKNMEKRAKEINGKLKITSELQKGTTVNLRLPIA
jgi:two-component system, NarL family, sensor histidine kinase UhpB